MILAYTYLRFKKLKKIYFYKFGRTESGSNIILVTQVSLQKGNEFKFCKDEEIRCKDEEFRCKDDENQVLVYEFGETFGGYWGPIPDSVLKDTNPSSPVVYTLATRAPSTTEHIYDYD